MKAIAISLLFALHFFIAKANEAPVINPENTYVFIVGVLEWESPSLNPFSKKNRKDEELYRLFLEKGVKVSNIIFLKDEEATLVKISRGLGDMLNRTSANSTFVFYYAGHGVRAGNGPVCFANYDYSSSKGNGLEAEAVGDLISKRFKGNQVWLLADCCYSGVLLSEAKKISTTGKSVMAFTSSMASNTSTSNWTFTQTILDCLNGISTSDRNMDKKITLSEVRDELHDAMRFRERQLSGTAFYNVGESVTFNVKPVPPKAPLTLIQYVYVLHDKKFQPARVLSLKDNVLTGELYHYSDKMQVTVPVTITKPIEYAEYPVGLKVQVEWNGKNYPAEIKESKNGFHYIHYTGYDNSWDEWVTYDRISGPEKKKCTIEWQGVWYPGEMLQMKNGKYFVHYVGYGNDWDEWVPASRIKL